MNTFENKKIKKSFFLLIASFLLMFASLFLGEANQALACSDIRIDKETTFEGEATVGNIIPYTITVNNDLSSIALKDVEVSDSLILNLSGPVGDDNGDNKVQPSETWVYAGTYMVTESDICSDIENTATARARWDYCCNNPAGPVEDTVAVPTTYTAQISIDKETSFIGSATVGDEIDYTITVTNLGNVTVNDVTVNDLKLEIVGDTSVGSLSPGESKTIGASYIVTEDDLCDPIINTATAVAVDLCGEPVPVVEDSLSVPTVCFGSISGTKYNDLNGNGVWNCGEPVLEGWEITLSGDGAGTTLTNGNGYYEFTNLSPGTYTLTETLQAGWVQTESPDPVDVNWGDDISDLNFGNRRLSICGTKYEDKDGSGDYTSGDKLIESWEINLSGGKNEIATTDKNGEYCFYNLEPGNYTVTEDTSDPNWISTSPELIDVNLEDTDSFSNDFFNFQKGKISGTKYNDKNGNEKKDECEPALEGWEITLCLVGGECQTTTTDGNGYYEFTGLAPGIYTLTETQETGWVQTESPESPFTVVSGDSKTADFLNYQEATISGHKYNDKDGDGVWDQGEPALNGWEICLNGECVITGDGAWADGYYEFTGLAPGIYTLTETQKAGWVQTASPESPFTLISGDNISNLNFGNRGDLTITGHKYNDLNGNGVKDAGEQGIEGWEIVLSGDKTGTALTDVDGYYSFANLEPGNYTVAEETRNEWVVTSDVSFSFTGMTENKTADFFNCPQPDLEIEKTNDVSTFINPGGEVTYTITITNNGVGSAIDFTVEDVLPAGFTYIDGTSVIDGATGSGPIIEGNVLTWIIENLDPGDSFTITYETLTDSDISAGTYVNLASVEEEEDDSEVEVRKPRILALTAEKKVVKGEVLGAEVKTGLPILTILAISFLLTLTFYFIYCIRKKLRKAKIGLKAILK